MNAALKKGTRLAREDSAQLVAKYADVMGEDFPKLMEDLRSGEITPLTREYVWLELTRQQPVSKLEMPQWALENPNGRLLYSMKSWAMKQADLVRRDAYNQVKAGNTTKGMTNLAKFGFALGLGGATLAQIQNWMLGREGDPELGDVIENVAKTFALNEFTRTDVAKGDVIKAMINTATPPYRIFDDIIKGVIFADEPQYRNKLLRYIPGIGPLLYSHLGGGKERFNESMAKKERMEAREDAMTPQQKEERRKKRRMTPEERKEYIRNQRENNRYEIKAIKPIAGEDVAESTARNSREAAEERFRQTIQSKPEYHGELFKAQELQEALDRIEKKHGVKMRRQSEGIIDREKNMKHQRDWKRALDKRKVMI
jgi:hypothetical protein